MRHKRQTQENAQKMRIFLHIEGGYNEKSGKKFADIRKKQYLCRQISKLSKVMASYAITINDRSLQGQALLAYLEALKVNLTKIPSIRLRKSSYERSMEDIKHGRIKTYANADDMCKALGI